MSAIRRNIERSITVGAVALAAFGFASTCATADIDGSNGIPNFSMVWDATGDQFGSNTYNPDEYQSQTTTFGTWDTDQGTFTGWRYVGFLESSEWSLTWDCIVNDDPFIVATINVTNNSTSTQNYSNYMFLPIAGGPYNPTDMSGSVSAALTNNNFFTSGASLSATADPIYQAFIDGGANPPAGNSVRTMWNPGFSLVAPAFTPATNANDSFANEIGPGAFAEIGLRLQFDLSAGDSASVSGVFQFEAVPGPAALGVFAIFGILAPARRRRN